MWGMGIVERLMIEAAAKHPRGLTEEEALDAIVPPDAPTLRYLPAYKHCFKRLERRGMLEWIPAIRNPARYSPSTRALEELAQLSSKPDAGSNDTAT
ncbi:hypothetical protein PLANPX_4353 [Lacipirellula parvula]|uniref:Uncharacterized protein n=1 Tax=Lacipirellula parvula TaxID=2650471 RepID=A0A5K7XIF4_9BACT|nr:hypothetical protein PLANPX_4353 [Lacipirellula parvula]